MVAVTGLLLAYCLFVKRTSELPRSGNEEE